jgi:hypothetical protein
MSTVLMYIIPLFYARCRRAGYFEFTRRFRQGMSLQVFGDLGFLVFADPGVSHVRLSVVYAARHLVRGHPLLKTQVKETAGGGWSQRNVRSEPRLTPYWSGVKLFIGNYIHEYRL